MVSSILRQFEGIKDLNYDVNQNVVTIPTGIDLLDYVMGGGVPLGKIGLITGAPGGGKSTLAAQYIVGFQKHNPDSLAFYIDTEQGMSFERLSVLGCDKDRTVLLNAVTVEDVYTMTSKIIEQKILEKQKEVPYIVIWDSESATPTRKMLSATDSSQVMGEKSRTYQFVLNKLIPVLAVSNTTFIIISQLRNKIELSPYAPKKAELSNMGTQKITGGNAAEFLPFQLAFVNGKGEINLEKKDESCMPIKGKANEIKFIKNKNFTPLIPIELVINYDSGYSDFWTKARLLRKTKAFKPGSWCAFPEKSDIKFRWVEIKEVYDTNPEFKDVFDSAYEKQKSALVAIRSIKKEKELADVSEEDLALLDSLTSANSDLDLDSQM